MSHCKSGEVRIHIIGVLNTQYVNVISNNKTNDISSMESWELLSPTTADENLLDVPEATLSKSQISLSLSLSMVALRAHSTATQQTHAKWKNTSKLRKHLHHFDNTCAAFTKNAPQWPQCNTLEKSDANRPQHNGSVSRGHFISLFLFPEDTEK